MKSYPGAAAGPLRVGLVVGREWSWPPAFIDEVNRRNAGVVAEFARIDLTSPADEIPYAVLIDRISHEIPFYREWLKLAALCGCSVINNPFMWSADDKFFGGSLLTRLGIAQPRTVVLPNRSYEPGVTSEDLTNLEFPLQWEAAADWIGFPAILKDAHGGGWKEVHRVDSMAELVDRYNESGALTMILQEFIEWEHYVRCLCIGQDRIMPIKYDPGERRYHIDHAHMDAELGRTVVEWAQAINRALGYDMNTVEFAVRDGVPYAIDFMNPAPDMDVYSLTPFYFDWVVHAMADLAIERAVESASMPVTSAPAPRWDRLLAGSPVTPAAAGAALIEAIQE
jgi:hypothetical protein